MQRIDDFFLTSVLTYGDVWDGVELTYERFAPSVFQGVLVLQTQFLEHTSVVRCHFHTRYFQEGLSFFLMDLGLAVERFLHWLDVWFLPFPFFDVCDDRFRLLRNVAQR